MRFLRLNISITAAIFSLIALVCGATDGVLVSTNGTATLVTDTTVTYTGNDGYLVSTNGTTIVSASTSVTYVSPNGYLTSTNGVTLVGSNAAAAAAFSPTSAAGLAYYWDYTDLSAGAVSTWADRIQAQALAQATSAKRPTKDATGVLFTAAADGNLNTGGELGSTTMSNCTIWVTFKLTTSTAAWRQIFGSSAGNRQLATDGAVGGKVIISPVTGGTYFTAVAGTIYNWIILYTNSNAAGVIHSYTNGVQTTDCAGSVGIPFRVAELGNDAGPGYGEPFDGYIKFVGIWTNRWLTATEIANLNTWATAH